MHASYEESVVVYVDAATMVVNPGPSAIAAVFDYPDGRHDRIDKYIGKMDINLAECESMFFALQYAVRHNIRRLKLYSDSDVAVKRHFGEYPCKTSPVAEKHARCREIAGSLSQFEMYKVSRDQNREADDLAKAALYRELQLQEKAARQAAAREARARSRQLAFCK